MTISKVRRSVAETLAPALTSLLELPIRVRFWDASELGGPGETATLLVRSPAALSRLFFGKGQLGIARAYVSGELDLSGDLYETLRVAAEIRRRGAREEVDVSLRERVRILVAMAQLGALRPPPAPPREEIRLGGRRHSRARDAAAIAHHYDISNDFYRVLLGETMTYSCAYFARPEYSLAEAQQAKCDLICNKLGLKPGERLLDVGCGWGTMVIHAARHYRVRGVGITVSEAQAALARERVAEAGVSDLVEIRVQDYRDVRDGPFDAISSIGMFEHVGRERTREYFEVLRALLRDGGRLLNHAISRPGASSPRTEFARDSFIDRYVFPDGELLEVGTVVSMMQSCGLEVRDVESLREHYARTLRCWVENLEDHLDELTALVGDGRIRVWRLYMIASALNFAENRTSIHQVLGVRTAADGGASMPSTRARFAAHEPHELSSV